jgi:hypothetical protein
MKAYTTALIILIALGINSCYYDNEAELYGNNANCTDTVSSYNGRLKGIIDSKCVACHNTPGPESDDFRSFAGVNNFKEAIVCRVVEKGSSCNKPAMPPSNDLTECDIEAFKLWQQNGFRE